jgi:hypothetical protein
MRREYEKLRRQRLEEFMSGFGSITLKLKEMYQMITLGRLLLFDSQSFDTRKPCFSLNRWRCRTRTG